MISRYFTEPAGSFDKFYSEVICILDYSRFIYVEISYNHVLEVDHEYILFLANDWSRYIGT